MVVRDLSTRVISQALGFGKDKRAVGVALGLVLLWATVLRLWGAGFDLPYVYHPDEPTTINLAVRMLQSGDINPHWYHWGSGYFYLVVVAYVLYFLSGWLTGSFDSRLDLSSVKLYGLGMGHIQLPAEVWLARLISIILGVGTVWLAYRLGRALYNSKAGIFAAALLAVSPAHVRQSHYAVPETTMIFFVCLSMLYVIGWLKKGQRRDSVWVGLWGGLAAATKYNAAGLIFVAMGVAQLLRYGRRAWRKSDILWTGGGAVVGLIIGMPAVILAPREVWEGVSFAMRSYAGGHAGMEGDSLLWYLRFLWSQHLLLPLALGGIVWGVYRRMRAAVLLGVVILIYVGFISTFTVRAERIILPLVPLMAALGGVVLAWGVERVSQIDRLAGFVRGVLVLVVIVITLLPPLIKVVAGDRNLSTRAVQTMARDWITAHIPTGTPIVSEAYGAVLHPEEYQMTYLNYGIDHAFAWYCEQGFEYAVLSETAHGRFFFEPDRYPTEVAAFERLMVELELVHELRGPFLIYPDRSVFIFRVPCED